MTNLNIIPNFDKKTAKFEGAIAAGENIHVNISNIGGYIVGTENLRLRAVGSKGEALAQFPLLGDENLNWVKDGDTIECDLNLNTVQMLEAVPPAARVMILFVLDNPKDEILYFKSFVSVDHWPRRVGEDEPVDLGGYTDFVQETLRSIESIEDRVDEAEKIAKDAQESASGSAESAAQMVTQIDANAKAISAEAARAEGAESALGEAIAKKADTDDVWLRGNDATGETNHAKSIKVKEIEALDDESGIKFTAPIVSSTIIDDSEKEQNLTIKGNEISAPSFKDEDERVEWGGIVLNGTVIINNGGISSPNAPIHASSFDSFEYYVISGGSIYFADPDSSDGLRLTLEKVKSMLSKMPRYPFANAEVVDRVVTVAPYTNAKLESDGTAFEVAVGGESGYVRDCVLMVVCSNENAPTITWGDNFHPRTNAETDFACEAGKRNVYWISEYEANHFAVAGWQETIGGSAQ